MLASCAAGVPMSFHDASTGAPIVNPHRFPDMKALVDYGHSLGLKVSATRTCDTRTRSLFFLSPWRTCTFETYWCAASLPPQHHRHATCPLPAAPPNPRPQVGTYLNNCICMENRIAPHYEQDAAWMLDMGFDGVKIDACGSSHNISRYAELFNASGRPVRIENCHNSAGPNSDGVCPMNMYRSGGDIHAGFIDILGKIYGTIGFNDRAKPASFPGCWAYPDM